MAGEEFAIQWHDGRRWRSGGDHMQSAEAAREWIEKVAASGPYPSGAPQPPRRVVSRPVGRWTPVRDTDTDADPEETSDV